MKEEKEMLDMVFDSSIKRIEIKMHPLPSCSEEYIIETIEGGYRISKTIGSGIYYGALNNYQIDLNFMQAEKMFYKMNKVFSSLEWDKDIDTLEIPYSNWMLSIEFQDGLIKKTSGKDFKCEKIEPLIKILKSTIRWIL